VSVVTRVRVPDQVRAAEALSPGCRIVRGTWIECAPWTSRALVRIVPAAGGPG
jgi:hypothetical protein